MFSQRKNRIIKETYLLSSTCRLMTKYDNISQIPHKPDRTQKGCGNYVRLEGTNRVNQPHARRKHRARVSYSCTGRSFLLIHENAVPRPHPRGSGDSHGSAGEHGGQYKGQNLDLIVFGCTSGSFIKGIGWDQECIKRIETASGSPGLTTSTAVMEALKALEAKTVAVLTPYPDATNEAERQFWKITEFM